MNLKVNREDMLEGSLTSCMLKVAVPLMVLYLVNTLYGFVDTYFVGLMGELQMGAVSLVAPVTSCAAAFGAGLSSAGVAMVSRAVGEKNDQKANMLATHVITLAVVLGVIATALTLLLTDPILSWLNTPADIYEDTRGYFVGISLDYMFLFIISTYQAIRQACGDSRSGVRLNLIASVLNTVLDPLFIFTFGMGTMGAALATVLAKALVCPVAFRSLTRADSPIRVSLRKYRIDRRVFGKLMMVSLPASLGQLLNSLGFVLMSREIVSYGSLVMSGYAIGSRISSIFYVTTDSIGFSLPAFIGANLGASNPKRARESYRVAMKLVVGMSVLMIALGCATVRPLAGLFVRNAGEELMGIALEYAYFCILTAFFMGWFNSLCGVFSGSTNTLLSMILSSARLLVVRMPLVWLLARFTSLGYTGIWVSMILSNFILCITGQILYVKYPWDRKAVTV